MLSSSSTTRIWAAIGLSWCWWPDSNGRPTDYESVALPAELHQREGGIIGVPVTDLAPPAFLHTLASPPGPGKRPFVARGWRPERPKTILRSGGSMRKKQGFTLMEVLIVVA